MKRELLNIITRILASIALMVGGVTTGFVTLAAPASATTYVHVHCDYSSCQEPSDSSIYLGLDCEKCSQGINDGAVATVRSQNTSTILDKLIVTTSTGTFTEPAGSLSNCNYNNTCHFTFKGTAKTADLYGHTGVTVSPKPAPKPSPKPAYTTPPTHTATSAPTHATTVVPKPTLKANPSPTRAATVVQKTVAKPKPTLKPTPSPKPVVVVPSAVQTTLPATPDSTPSATPLAVVQTNSPASVSRQNQYLGIGGILLTLLLGLIFTVKRRSSIR